MDSPDDPRIEQILDHIMQLAASRLGHRTPQSERGDVIDAIICGLNMLGEELERTLVSREAMMRERNLAEEANQAKTRFLANMSHELRTPLTAIAGFNRVLLERGRELGLPEDFARYQNYIDSNSNLLISLVDDVLEVSRIEAGNIEVSEQAFDLAELVEGIHNSYQARALDAGLSFSCTCADGLPERMCADGVKLTQILGNLIDNAIKYSPAGGRVELSAAGDGDAVVFRVRDDGIGIPPDRQDDIFERFTRLEPSARAAQRGVGLGLHITRALVDALGGEIAVSSALGEGSCFTVRVPDRRRDAAAPSPASEPAQARFSPGSRVLAVEDNPINQELIQAVLDDMGIETEVADNGRDGIDKALAMARDGKPPDLILMDLQMPVMGGLEAIDVLGRTPPLSQIPIVVLTADALDVQKPAFGDARIAGYLTKPIDFDRLSTVLSRYLPTADRAEMRDGIRL